MSLTIDNKTHWRTSDVERIIRDALKVGGGDVSETRLVFINYQKKKNGKGSRVSYVYYRCEHAQIGSPGNLNVYLPKRGPKDTHPNAMVALAASRDMATAGISEKTVVLAVSDTYFLANAFAWEFATEAARLYEEEECISNEERKALSVANRSIQCPPWGDSARFFIQKYKDPKKDGTYLDKVEKKKALIKRAEREIATAEHGLASAKKSLKRAKARKKAAEKSLRDMAARRS